jgi:hypothetical protein
MSKGIFGMMIGNSAFVGAWSAELEAVAGAAQVVPAAELVGQLLTVLQSTSVCPVAQTLPLAVSGSAQQDEAVFPPVEALPVNVAQHLPAVADAL